jgi:hypothetical protein
MVGIKRKSKLVLTNGDGLVFDYHIEPLLSEYLRSEYNEEDIEKHVKNLKNHFKLESK